jgi:hypothetical protein
MRQTQTQKRTMANGRPLIFLFLQLLGVAFPFVKCPRTRTAPVVRRLPDKPLSLRNEYYTDDGDVEHNKTFAMARFLLQRILSSILMEPLEVWRWSQPMLEPPIYNNNNNNSKEAKGGAKAHRKLVHDVLTQASKAAADSAAADSADDKDDDAITTSTVSDPNSKTEVNLVKNRDVVFSYISENDDDSDRRDASTYGEATELGVRQLLYYMNIYGDRYNYSETAVRFYDLGSGTGKVILQVYMQVPQLSHAVGIELSPTRHDAAVRAYQHAAAAAATVFCNHNDTCWAYSSRLDEARASMSTLMTAAVSSARTRNIRSAKIELLQGDLFSLDLSNATHIWISSLCFPRIMMEQVAQKIINDISSTTSRSLKCIATLQTSPLLDHAFGTPRVELVEMTWTKPRGGSLVYLYDTFYK